MSDWLPSLNALRAFEAVSRHLSFRKAADELHVTPAAVKQLVRNLEKALGRALVRRQGRGLVLTEVGTAGLAELRQAFESLAASVAKMRRLDERRLFTITVEPAFAAVWLVRRLQGFKHQQPDIDVLIDASLRIVDLEREAADVAIRYGGTAGTGLVVHRLFDDEVIAVCSPAVAAGPPPIEGLGDLARVAWIHFEMSPWPRGWLDWTGWLRALGAEGIESRRDLRFTDYTVALQAAAAGQGLVLTSRPLVEDALAAGLLVSPFEEAVRGEGGYDVVTTRASARRPEVAAFIDWILAEVAAGRPQGPGIEPKRT